MGNAVSGTFDRVFNVADAAGFPLEDFLAYNSMASFQYLSFKL